MNTASSVSIAPIAAPAIGSVEALGRLGDEIAELAAHLDAATAHLLDLIREFDARGGWANGFSSCAAWLTWRVGLDPGAARERCVSPGLSARYRGSPTRSRMASSRTRRFAR